MYLPNTHHLVNHEQYQDRLREIERQRLVKLVAGQSTSSKLVRRTVSRLGLQMVKWGSKLQHYVTETRYVSPAH